MKSCQFSWSVAAIFSFGLFFAAGCVPKTSYEDKLAELEALQSERRAQQWEAGDCNPELLSELREQIQSLDHLSQELIDRNTELSREVARLRRREAEAGRQGLECSARLQRQAENYEGQLERTRTTYEDMIEELRKQIRQ